MQIILANPRGFCAGVDRAIEIVERTLELFGAPIYVRHEVVHNKFVVDGLRDKGAVFVEELEEVPDDATVIFSAHGVSLAVQEEAKRRGLTVFDATCPLVTKVHLEVMRYAKMEMECILIGHAGHPEVEGTMGRYYSGTSKKMADTAKVYLVETVKDVETLAVHHPDKLAFVTQTTLSMDDTSAVIDALRKRFPEIQGPKKDDICYATQNRQDAVKKLSSQVDIMLVVGSVASSNSNRLREVAERFGIPAYLVDGPESLEKSWFDHAKKIGVTAGASAPEILVERLIEKLDSWGFKGKVEFSGVEENIIFPIPKELKATS